MFKKYITICFLYGVLASMSLLGQKTPEAPPVSAFNPNKPTPLPIVVTPEGFPQQPISLQAGYYFVVIVNRSGIQGLQVAIEKMPGDSILGAADKELSSKGLDPRAKRLTEVLQLTRGTYRIRALHNASWSCTISVK